jgi:hypothetical protein
VEAPPSATAGEPFSVTISADDAEGNSTTDVSAATLLSVDTGTIDPVSISEAEFTDDGVWTGNVTLSEEGAIVRRITATNGGSTGEDTITIPGALAGFTLEVPASATAGEAFSIAITAKDADGNTTTRVSGDTTLSVGAGTISPVSIPEAAFTDDGVWTGDVTLSEGGLRSITAANGASGATGGNVLSIIASDEGTLESFTVYGPGSAIAETAFSVTISANDAEGNTTTGVSGDSTLSVDAGTISPTIIEGGEFTDDGLWTGDVTLSDGGSRIITITNNGKAGQDTVTVQYKLTLSVTGSGSTTPGSGSHAYASGADVDVSARAGDGWQFDTWTGGVADSESAETTVTLDANKTVVANFSWLGTSNEFHFSEGCSVCHELSKENANLLHVAEQVDLTRLVSPKSGTRNVTYPTGETSDYVREVYPWDGICQACHTNTDYYRNDGSSPGGVHHPGENCMTCHLHWDEFAAGTGKKIHAVHFVCDRGPGFSQNQAACYDCHAEGTAQCVGGALFWDSEFFETTQVCGVTCHNPAGP